MLFGARSRRKSDGARVRYRGKMRELAAERPSPCNVPRRVAPNSPGKHHHRLKSAAMLDLTRQRQCGLGALLLAYTRHWRQVRSAQRPVSLDQARAYRFPRFSSPAHRAGELPGGSRDMLSSPRLDGRRGRLQGFLSCIFTEGRVHLDPSASPRGLPKAPPYIANPARVE
jgi:hypothetical protein